MRKRYTTYIYKCPECPYYRHSGAFTPGGAKNLCGALTGNSDDEKKWQARIIPDTGAIERDANGRIMSTVRQDLGIPVWCPLEDD